jgi:hypothetical protein
MPTKRARAQATAVVSRKLAGDLVVMNVFGKQTPNMVRCECGEWKFKSEFYLESSSKRKHPWQVRFQCTPCWDQFHGKKLQVSQPITKTLESFMEKEDA